MRDMVMGEGGRREKLELSGNIDSMTSSDGIVEKPCISPLMSLIDHPSVVVSKAQINQQHASSYISSSIPPNHRN